jgi:hypothetical protein
MNTIPLSQLVPILQLAIGPVILISGVSLLLLTLTNRFGRLLDRARLLSHERAAAPSGAAGVGTQIDILHRRATILRFSIILGSITVLLVAVLILALFVAALLKLEWGWLIAGLFCASQISLIGSVMAFIRDMNLSLAAVRLEIQR